MKIESCRFGTIEVADDRVLRLVCPILGFDRLDHFALIEDPESAPIAWLQAVDAPEVLLPVVDAALVAGEWALDLEDGDIEGLDLERAEDARVLCILTLSPDPGGTSVNLRAPIVWNTRRATAKQVVLRDTQLPVNSPVRAAAPPSP